MGLVGWVNPGSSGVDEGAGDQRGAPAVDAAGGQRPLERVEDGEADGGLRLGTAPVQRHGRHDVRGELVLDEQVADLGAVAVREHDVMAGRDEARDVLHRAADRVALLLGRGTAVRAGHGIAAERDEDPHAHLHWSRA